MGIGGVVGQNRNANYFIQNFAQPGKQGGPFVCDICGGTLSSGVLSNDPAVRAKCAPISQPETSQPAIKHKHNYKITITKMSTSAGKAWSYVLT